MQIFFREIAFLTVLNFFLLLVQNWIFVKKFFREIDLFDITTFLAWTFLLFLALCASIE